VEIIPQLIVRVDLAFRDDDQIVIVTGIATAAG
jgi:hypothetical protein